MRHRIHRPQRRSLIAGAIGAVIAATIGVVLVTTGAVSAGAAGGTTTTPVNAPNGYHACVDPNTWQLKDGAGRPAIWPNDAAHPLVCSGGRLLVEYASLQQAQNAVPQVTASATTAVANWPEGSGWANDTFSRILNLTRQHAAESAKCGGTPACWFYTGTLVDQGSFTTVAGAKAPNGDGKTISGIVSGSMVGGAQLEFYASSGTPTGSSVPATASGDAKPASTTNWAKLAFPDGTTFSPISLTQYKWVYTATSPNTCEVWTDAINPGDDGQSEADGNITGVNACTQ